MTSPAIAVVISAKDAAATLRRAVGSMLDQTLTDFEIIIVDDNSADGTHQLATSIAAQDRRVKVLRSKSPGGIVAALQTGTDAISAPLLARMDADDFSYPTRLQLQSEFLSAHPGIAACGCLVHVPNPLGAGMKRYVNWSNSLVSPEQIARERFVESPIVQPGVMLRTSAFQKIGGYRDHDGGPEDYDLWLRMLDAGMKFQKIPEILLDWHDSPTRLTRANTRYSPDQFLKAKAHFLARLPIAKSRGISLSGAGPTGKRLARFLLAEGATIHTFYEVHPRRIGETIAHTSVLSDSKIPPASSDTPLLISAVGTPAARQKVRTLATRLGYQEGKNFFAAS